VVVSLCIYGAWQRWARIRTGSRLKPILAGAGLDRTAFFLIVRSGLDQTEKICYFNEIIQPVSKYFSCNPILHRFAELKSIFCHQWQKVRVLVQDLLSECRFRVHILGLGSGFAFWVFGLKVMFFWAWGYRFWGLRLWVLGLKVLGF